MINGKGEKIQTSEPGMSIKASCSLQQTNLSPIGESMYYCEDEKEASRVVDIRKMKRILTDSAVLDVDMRSKDMNGLEFPTYSTTLPTLFPDLVLDEDEYKGVNHDQRRRVVVEEGDEEEEEEILYILKADTHVSLSTIQDVILEMKEQEEEEEEKEKELSNISSNQQEEEKEGTKFRILHTGVGDVTYTDAELAAACNGTIIGF